MLSDGSVLVMGGLDSSSVKNDVWKTVDGGASWILVTSSAGWTGKKILHLSNSLPILPSLGEDALVYMPPPPLQCVWCLFCRCDESTLVMIILEAAHYLAIAKISVIFYLMRVISVFSPIRPPRPLPLPYSMKGACDIDPLLLPLSLSFHVIVARAHHTSVVLSNGSVLVMGGNDGSNRKNDVWKTVDGGASWILVTSSAGWTGKKIILLLFIA